MFIPKAILSRKARVISASPIEIIIRGEEDEE